MYYIRFVIVNSVANRIKLSDIAQELDVSVGLVSLVLSGKSKENRISDVMAQKVIDKAEELGYRANQLARGLRTGRSGIIGLIVADIANPFFGKMARSVENRAFDMGYQVMFGSSDENPDKLGQLIDVMVSRQVDGLVIVPVRHSQDQLRAVAKHSIPMVLIDRDCPGVAEDLCCADNFAGAMTLTKLLLDKGYKKVGAFVLDQVVSNNIDRINGYKAALKQQDLEVDEKLIFTIAYQDLENDLEPALMEARAAGCDALFFANNSIGIKSLKLVHEKGISIPDELGIVSFDNPEAFHISNPGITCYEQPIELICSQAVELITDKIKKQDSNPVQKIVFEGKLIERNSC